MPIETNPVRVLLVEDDPDVARMVELALKWKGYDVSLATSVAEAVSSLVTFQPHVVISDVCLPDGQLSSLLEPLAEICPPIPVVAMSGFDRFGAGESRSVALYLQKPFPPSVLIDTVAFLADSGGAEASW